MFGQVGNSGQDVDGNTTKTAPYISESPSFAATQRVLDEVCAERGAGVGRSCKECSSRAACDEAFDTTARIGYSLNSPTKGAKPYTVNLPERLKGY